MLRIRSTATKFLVSLVLVIRISFPGNQRASFAYSGLQTLRDDADTCCSTPNKWNWGYAWTGYDNDYHWESCQYSPGCWDYEWRPYPSPSPTVMCVYPYFANVSQSVGTVTMEHEDSAGHLLYTHSFNENVYRGTWPPFDMSDSYYYGDFVQEEDDAQPNQPYTADVITFHYNSNYTSCT